MDKNLIELINKIRNSDDTLIYSSLRNLFTYLNAPFCKFDIIAGHPPLFRVRTHTEDENSIFFHNEYELSFRRDIPNINSYGRCNEPLQSLFYASDSDLISFAEVIGKNKIETLKDVTYLTTGVWNFTQNIMVSPIFEPDNVNIANPSLLDVTKKCNDFIDSYDTIPQKDDLKNLLKGLATEFIKPFSLDKKSYLFSAAYSNYMFDSIGIDSKQIEGIVYPTCITIENIRHLGLNYVFKNSIIGFDKKLKLVDAFRTKLAKGTKDIIETERIYCKKIDKSTGEILW